MITASMMSKACTTHVESRGITSPLVKGPKPPARDWAHIYMSFPHTSPDTRELTIKGLRNNSETVINSSNTA